MRKKNRENEEEIRQKNILLADLAKPTLKNGFDVSLFTFKEYEEIEKSQVQHDAVFYSRAEELRFYPDILTKKERKAILRCMTYKELKPYYHIVSIEAKISRLMVLSTMEQIEIRKYTRMTHQFNDKNFDREIYSDRNIVEITENYFKIMRQNREKVYEEPYYFLEEKRRQRVLRFLENFVPKVKGWNSEDNLVLEPERIWSSDSI